MERCSFTEMPTNRFVESAFWNFDAMFVPQQHPAREMQDTFYVKGAHISNSWIVPLWANSLLQTRPKPSSLMPTITSEFERFTRKEVTDPLVTEHLSLRRRVRSSCYEHTPLLSLPTCFTGSPISPEGSSRRRCSLSTEFSGNIYHQLDVQLLIIFVEMKLPMLPIWQSSTKWKALLRTTISLSATCLVRSP